MKDIFTDSDSARVGLYKSLLDEAGIACFVRNENFGPTSVPIPVFYPTLCVLNDADYDRAVVILDDYQKNPGPRAAEWVCPHCRSTVPAGFDTCWNCEREKPRENGES